MATNLSLVILVHGRFQNDQVLDRPMLLSLETLQEVILFQV
ncbi:hypothetical protein Vi05172_g563 [Venturia inaequalis]|nr:hypothetical protein Vi05172_g563 [Venturia inaequalis]